jgi:hypothetical protein
MAEVLNRPKIMTDKSILKIPKLLATRHAMAERELQNRCSSAEPARRRAWRGDNLNGTLRNGFRITQRGKNETRAAAQLIRAMQSRAV